MATYAQTVAAMRQGLTGFTHLFNAMRPLQSREPGPIAAALESPDAWYGLIVDGIHVAPAMLRLALRGAGHPILVTDAMPPVGGTRPSFRLNGEDIVVRDGRCATQRRHLGRHRARHGNRCPQLRRIARRAADERAAFCLDASGAISRPRSHAGPATAGIPRRHGRSGSPRASASCRPGSRASPPKPCALQSRFGKSAANCGGA